MAKDIFYTAIDIGTTKVCSIIARIGPEGELKVLGVGTVPSQGMLKGKVSDQEEAQQAVKASLEEAQRYMGRGVSWAYLSVSGDHITSLNTTSSLNGDRGETPISEQDLMSLVQASRPMQGRRQGSPPRSANKLHRRRSHQCTQPGGPPC